MRQFLCQKYGQDNVIANHAYVIAKGDIPVALVAHADTVFSRPPVDFFYDTNKNVLWSPDGMGADDRAGIYSIMQIVRSGLRPHVIITTGEESGCIGATKMMHAYKEHPFNELKFIIQLDRRNFKDSVYYDCDNEDFENFITPFGFKTEWGTLSDISVIAPIWGVAAVNFSVGYVEEHTKQERLYVDALFATIEKVKNILTYVQEHSECPTYEYVESTFNYPYNATYRYAYSYNDDGYNLIPAGVSTACCNLCGTIEKQEDLLRIKWDDNLTLDMCNECYASMYEDIEWCCECKEGWVLTDREKAALVTPEDRSHWKCKNCRGKGNLTNGYEYAENANGESGKALTKFVAGKSRVSSASMGAGKKSLHRKNARTRL